MPVMVLMLAATDTHPHCVISVLLFRVYRLDIHMAILARDLRQEPKRMVQEEHGVILLGTVLR